MPRITKYDVMCPLCCGVFHETNGRFRTDVPAKGDMFNSKQHVIDAGWSTFPPYDTTEYANVVCPSCDAQYLDSDGRVLRLIEAGGCEEIPSEPSPITEFEKLLAEYEPPVPVVEQVAEPVESKPSDSVLTAGKVKCPVCGEMYAERGLRVHIAAKHPEVGNA